MTLSEKIIYCRKKAMLSQETLAEKLGVSRQAVSKWETGDAIPDTSNLSALAKVLGTTVDWLLSHEEAETSSSKSENLLSFIKTTIQKYGWLSSIPLILCGIFFSLQGILLRYFVISDYKNLPDIMWETIKNSVLKDSPLYLFGNILLGIGIGIAIAGIILGIILKMLSKK
jgi:transcriptional regulator with XRE-family HTH domain